MKTEAHAPEEAPRSTTTEADAEAVPNGLAEGPMSVKMMDPFDDFCEPIGFDVLVRAEIGNDALGVIAGNN